jgi:hypothetical protein
MAMESLTKVKVTIATIGAILGGIWGIIEGYGKITDYIDESVKAKVEEFSKPLIDKDIRLALDSLSKKKKFSFREGLADEIGVEKENVIPTIGHWYKEEHEILDVGLKYDIVHEELIYIHTDGKRYRTHRDSVGYFFYHGNHVKEYCFK